MITIVPAIDIINGKCVRLSQGDYNKRMNYASTPLDLAKAIQDAGCTRLHLVDLDGAISHHIVNYKILEQVANGTSLIIDFGGGIKSDEDAHVAFESGANMITGGSIAVKNPMLFQQWLNQYGSDKIILGADTNKGKIAIQGWTKESEHDVVPFINDYQSKGVKKVICTDVQCDGMLSGPSYDLYQRILEDCNGIQLIASGGIRTIEDINRLNILAEILKQKYQDKEDMATMPEVIVGKALLEGYITYEQLEKYNSKINQ